LSSIFEAKPIFEILGLLFDVSKTKANDAFNYWIEILRDIYHQLLKWKKLKGCKSIAPTTYGISINSR